MRKVEIKEKFDFDTKFYDIFAPFVLDAFKKGMSASFVADLIGRMIRDVVNQLTNPNYAKEFAKALKENLQHDTRR